MSAGLRSRPIGMNPYCPGCGLWIVNEDRTIDVTRDPDGGAWWHWACWMKELRRDERHGTRRPRNGCPVVTEAIGHQDRGAGEGLVGETAPG